MQQTVVRRATRAFLVPPRAYAPFVVGLVLLLITAVIGGIAVGSASVPPAAVVGSFLSRIGLVDPAALDARQDAIIWNFRVPRVLLAVVVGAGLAIAGAALQVLVRNPLADPYVLGISQGASFGVVLVIALGTAAVGRIALTGAAFLGALVVLLAVLAFGRRAGRYSPTRLVLAGVALGYVFSAATSAVQLRIAGGNSLAGIVFWLLGTLSAASWSDLGLPSVLVVLALVWLMLRARWMNALLLGSDGATALGISVNRFRRELIVISSLLSAAVVAVAGGVGFVGLMIPHAARMLVGADHRRMLPVAMLAGAVFLVLADLVARTAMAPVELPLSVVTAAVGGPFFLWLLTRTDRMPGSDAS